MINGFSNYQSTNMQTVSMQNNTDIANNNTQSGEGNFRGISRRRVIAYVISVCISGAAVAGFEYATCVNPSKPLSEKCSFLYFAGIDASAYLLGATFSQIAVTVVDKVKSFCNKPAQIGYERIV